MSQERTIVAKVTVKQEHLPFVKEKLLKLLAPTHKEDGCLQYDLHQDNRNPCVFLLFERWESLEQWQRHLEQPHITEFIRLAEDYLIDLNLWEMNQLKPQS